MDTKIVVALIAVAGVLAQVVVSYLISRQSANDVRTNIAREIDIVLKLSPESEEVTKLENHIAKSIDALINRDERRDRISNIISTFGPLPAVLLLLWGERVWAQHGLPTQLALPIHIMTAVLVGIALGNILILTWQLGELLYLLCRLSLQQVHLWWLAVKLWLAKRKSAKLQRRLDAIEPKFFAVRDYNRKFMEYMMSHKDEMIAERGQEWWDDMIASRAEIDQLGDAIEAEFKAEGDAGTQS